METLGFNEENNIFMLCDINSAIKLSKNPIFHGRSKHIDVIFHFLSDFVKDGRINLSYCNTQDKATYIMTKPVKLEQFLKLRSMLGMAEAQEIN